MHFIKPGAPGYDSARTTWNARFESRPSLIAAVTSTQDVVEAVRLARERGLALTAKSGGHDYAGNSTSVGGLLIDLAGIDAIRVDSERRRATAGAGVRWGAVDAATQAHGLATPGGTVSTVGITGFTLGGGVGWLARKHGLACDNLVSAEMVTAGGAVVTASENENPDLLWGLRGAGANLGVVTRLEYALHPLDHDVLAGQVIYPLERAGELLRFYRDFMQTAPDEVACFPFFYRVPPLEVFPREHHGSIVLALVVAYMGPVEAGEQALAPFRDLGDPILDGVFPQPYVDLQTSFDAGMGSGARWYTRSFDFETLTDECIDVLVGGLGDLPGDFTTVYLGPGGGAAGRVPVGATAYPHRTAAHNLHIFPGWSDAAMDDGVMTWARELAGAVAPFANPGVYVNLLGEDESERVRASYGDNYDRLSALKAEWDPENVFASNHNIPPGS